MPNDPYTKREQDQFHGQLMERMDKQDDMLDKITIQTTKTNGRVNELEIKARLQSTRLNTSVVIIAFIIGSIIVPLLAVVIAAYLSAK